MRALTHLHMVRKFHFHRYDYENNRQNVKKHVIKQILKFKVNTPPYLRITMCPRKHDNFKTANCMGVNMHTICIF